MKSLNFVILAVLLFINPVNAQDLKRYDPYEEVPPALRLTLGDPRVGFTHSSSDNVARVGETDYWLVGGELSSYHQTISMVKLDRDLGECSTQQVLEAGGVWSYSNNFNLLFAGRPYTDGSNTRIHSQAGSGLTYSCFDLKSNALLWTFSKKLPVLSSTFSTDQKSVIVLAGESYQEEVQRRGVATLYWLDARTGAEQKKVEIPGESVYSPFTYYSGTLVDTKGVTYVFRKSEKEPQIYAIPHKATTAEPLDEKLGFKLGEDIDWKIRVQPIQEKWITFHHRQKIHLFEIKKGRFIEKQTVEGGTSRYSYDDCENVKFTPDGKRLIAGSNRHTLIVDLEKTGELEKRLDFGTTNLEFTSDGQFMVFWDMGGAWPIKTSNWESVRAERVKTEAFHCCPIEAVTFSPDSKYLVSNDNHRFMVWDTVTGKLLAELTSPRAGDEKPCLMQSVIWDQAHGVIYGSDGFDALQWKVKDFAGKAGVSRLKGEVAFGALKNRRTRNGLIDIALDSSGEHILVSDQRSITYRKFSNPGVSKDIPLGKVDILSAPRFFVIQPEKQTIFAASGSSLNRLDLAGVKAPQRLSGTVLAISPDSGTYLTVTSRKKSELEVRSLKDGEVIKNVSADMTRYSVNTLSQDGKLLAFVSSSPEHQCLVTIIDMELGTVAAKVPFPTKVMSLTISPDGKSLAVGAFNRSVQIWDIGKIRQN